MKKVFVLIIAAASIASCNKEPKPLSKQQIDNTIDSITRMRIRESDEQAQKDLDRRMRIELKVRVDSIVNARAHANVKDSVKVQNGKPTPASAAKKINVAGNI